MFIPGCFCCTSCAIFSDDYSTDQLSTAYTSDAGSFTVTGGALTTTSANARLRANATSPTGHGRLVVNARHSAGGVIVVIGAYADSNNYLFVKLDPGAGEVTFWKRESGSDTQLGSTHSLTLVADVFYRVEICWDGTDAHALVKRFDLSCGAVFMMEGAFTGTGSGVALGSGAVPSGNVSFDALTFEKHQADDPACTPCNQIVATCADNLMNCVDGEFPAAVLVTLDFDVTGGLCAANCAQGLGSFLLTPGECALHSYGGLNICNYADFFPGVEECRYRWDNLNQPTLLAPACPYGFEYINRLNVFLFLIHATDGYRLAGRFIFASTYGTYWSWVGLLSDVISTAPIECMTDLDGVVLQQWCFDQGAPTQNICEIANATMTVQLP